MVTDILVGFCIGTLIFLALLFVWSLSKTAAPRNEEERVKEDYEQKKALGYFKNKEVINQTVTSGSPVIKE